VRQAGCTPQRCTRSQRANGRDTVNFFLSIRNFFQDVIAEFKRVSWPTRQATLQSTAVVLVVTLAVAAFLGAVDVGLASAVKQIIR